jgi:hypothetical protein
VLIRALIIRFKCPQEVQLGAFGPVQFGKGLVKDETREGVC